MRRGLECAELIERREFVCEAGLGPGIHEREQHSEVAFVRDLWRHDASVTVRVASMRYFGVMSSTDLRLDGRFWWWLVAATLVRSPVVMSAVAFTSITALLLGDPDEGGVLAAASVLGLLLGTPLAIAMQRRWSARGLLTAQLIACAACWVALAGAIMLGAGLWAWIWFAVAAGVAMAGSAGLVRATMTDAVPEPARARASTVDALSQDATVFLAPVAVSVGIAGGAPGAAGAVAVVSLLALVAVRLVVRDSSGHGTTAEREPEARGRSPRRASRVVAWSVLSLGIGLSLGAVEAGAVGLAVRLGIAIESAWLLFLVMAVSSAVGAWFEIAVLQSRSTATRLVVWLATFVAGCLLVAAGPQWATAIPGLVLVGLPIAALLGLRSNAFDADDDHQRSTGLTVAFAGQSIGFAVGAGLLAIVGQPGALLASVGVLVISAGSLLWASLGARGRH